MCRSAFLVLLPPGPSGGAALLRTTGKLGEAPGADAENIQFVANSESADWVTHSTAGHDVGTEWDFCCGCCLQLFFIPLLLHSLLCSWCYPDDIKMERERKDKTACL